MELSDSLGLPLYFEASPSTYKLYEKMGYEPLDEKVVHKAELMGTPTDITVPLMVKMPSSAKGLTFKEWRAGGYQPFGEATLKPGEVIMESEKTMGVGGIKMSSGSVVVGVKEVAA